MKQLLNISLALYIALVACYPCNDQEICLDEKKSGVEFSLSNHEHSPDEIDLCSPFCICNCCSSTINQPRYYSFTFYHPFNAEVHSVVKPHTVKAVSHSIWQPPKLA